MLQFISWLSHVPHRCSVLHMLQQHKCRVIVAITLSVKWIRAKLHFHRIWIPWGRRHCRRWRDLLWCDQADRAGTASWTRPPVTSQLELQTLAGWWRPVACSTRRFQTISGKFWRFKHVIVTQSSKPKPCACSSTEGNLWIKSSDTKNSSFHRFSSL